MILLVLVLLSSYAYAEAPVGSSAGIGVVGGSLNGVVIGDYNIFDPSKQVLDLNRYGGGVSKLYLGPQGVGLSLNSHSGAFISPLGPLVIGLEGAGGKIVAHSSDAVESFYQWTPMASTGIKVDIDKTQFLLLARGGGAVGNLGYLGWGPHTSLSYGASGYILTSKFDLGAEVTILQSGQRIINFDIQHRDIGVRYELTDGINNESQLLLLLRF